MNSGKLAGGQETPPLLFITSKAALVQNIGAQRVADLLAWMRDEEAHVFCDIPAGLPVTDVLSIVRPLLQEDLGISGVVILGGYDVMPAQRLDVLDPGLRSALPPTPDPDNFIVWSDDAYGDRDGEGFPEIPVSRIPDGYSGELLMAALRASRTKAILTRGGIRNEKRAFAETVFDKLPGTETMLQSVTTTWDQHPAYDIRADSIYLVLHGEAADGTKFWGEGQDGTYPIAITTTNVPVAPGSVVFTSSCWGALIVEQSASKTPDMATLRQRTPGSSIALSFIRQGASCFIGCTGSHYSPVDPPYGYNGQPLHEAFWRRYLDGAPPARALFEAKYIDYVAGIPFGRPGTVAQACAFKVLREFTCLGLGW